MIHEYSDTQKLRRWLAKQVGLDDLSEPLWERLCEGPWVKEWEQADRKDKEEFRNYALDNLRKDLKLLRQELQLSTPSTARPQRTRSHSREADLVRGDPVAARAEALCLYWGKLAGADSKVVGFREKVLGGTTVSTTDAAKLIRSPAAAMLNAERFRKKGVPIAGHAAELLDYERSKPFERSFRFRATIRLTWPGGERITTPGRKGAPPSSAEFWDGEDLATIKPWPSSVLRKLHDVAVDLTRRYPWKSPYAAWFVLTGEPPWVSPLTAHISGPDPVTNHGNITIEAAHWVPADVVRDFYSEAKADMGSASIPNEQRLALFEFVVKRSSAINELDMKELVRRKGLVLPPLRSLQAQWNETYPPGHQWHYKDIRNFRRAFVEASKALLGEASP